MSELRVGIIGAGGHAQSHFRMIQDEPEMALVAVADLDLLLFGRSNTSFYTFKGRPV